MKTAFKSEIREFKVTGVTTDKRKEKTLVNLAFSAQAKGRLVDWNSITGSTIVDVARIGAKGFGPGDISFRDFDWVVHITRGGKPVIRAMKATPRKEAIDKALRQILATELVARSTEARRYDLVSEASGPEEKTPEPKAEPKADDDLLEIPPFLKRDPGEKQPAAA